jgi:hypothetical protein
MSVALPVPPVVPVAPSRRGAGVELARQSSALSPATQLFRSIWFAALLGAICFEGLGRRYLPNIPGAVFYFLKDVVLIVGLIRFRIHRDVLSTFSHLYRGFMPIMKLGLLWTFVEIVNPEQKSIALGVLGFRAYWFWWIAPLVVASVLLDPVVRKKVVALQAGITIIVSIFAMLQFGAPADDSLNTYSVVDGEEVASVAVVTTGRARVSSTFSYITGFADFAILVPVLLLSIGLGETDRRSRLAALVGTLFAAASLPMSGSRGPLLISMTLCSLVVWRAGLIFTAVGRRVIVMAAAAIFTSVFAFPDALQGILDRFQGTDTEGRIEQVFNILPPVALATYDDYPPLGIGTGMMQNFREQLGVRDERYTVEGDVGRMLVELGAPGYLLVWVAKFGLVVVLLRSSRILKKDGRRAASAGAFAYALLCLEGNLVFDHIYSSLFFVGFGFIFHQVVQVRRNNASRSRVVAEDRRVVAEPALLAPPAPSAAT